MYWQNTNKLLEAPGFFGIKTGVTDTAGPCLCTAFRFQKGNAVTGIAKSIRSNASDIRLVVVVLNCATMEERWEDCKKINNWALTKHFGI